MDSRTIQQLTVINNSKYTDEQGFCPECGNLMVEVDRVNENGYMYIWLECSKSNCNGNWLKRKRDSSFVGV